MLKDKCERNGDRSIIFPYPEAYVELRGNISVSMDKITGKAGRKRTIRNNCQYGKRFDDGK